LGRETLFRQIGPLAGATMLWLLAGTVPSTADSRPGFEFQAGAVIAVAIVLTVIVPWHRLPDFLKAIPPILALLVGVRLQLLLDVSPWSASAFVLLPTFWLASFGTRMEIMAGLGATITPLVAQRLLTSVPNQAWRETAVLGAATVAVAFAVHVVFTWIRRRAERSNVVEPMDSLTGLPNRRGWELRVPQLLAEEKEARQPACVVALHLDSFAAFTEEHGRREADRLLRSTASLWRDRIRKGDVLARTDESEFETLLLGCSAEAAIGIARRLSTIQNGPLTISAGVAEWNGDESAAVLSRRAESAVERARHGGGDRVEFGTDAESASGDELRWADLHQS